MSISLNTDTPIDGLALIRRPVCQDHRGRFMSIYVEVELNSILPAGIRFLEDDVSLSRRGVLRGLHGDDHTWKLVSCLFGKIFFAVADLRHSSPTFKSVFMKKLVAEEGLQVLVPPGCVNGQQCLSEFSLFAYKQSAIYNGGGNQLSVRWHDPLLAIPWPNQSPILSDRDRMASGIKL